MRRISAGLSVVLLAAAWIGFAASGNGPYKVLKTAQVGGAGGFDYVNADSAGRRLYVARTGPEPRITVFNLDTLAPDGEIPGVAAHGAVVSDRTHHGFASSKPVTMFDSKTLAVIKKIDVEGNPDGLMYDPFNDHVFVLSHRAPNATVINAKTLAVTNHYDLQGKGAVCAGLALDVKHNVLFAACRNPHNMVILDATTGKILDALPIGEGCDGAVFDPKSEEAFSSQFDGTLTVIKENSPTSFAVEQTVETMQSAKTLTLDQKTNHILLIAAQFGPPPSTPPPGGRGGRGQMVPDSFSILMVGK